MHVRNTTNRDCHIGYQHGLQLAGFYDIRDEDDGPQDEAGTLGDFQGDLFGKYDEGDFEWPDDNDNGMHFSLSLGYNHCTHFNDNTADHQDSNTHTPDDQEADEVGSEDDSDEDIDMVEVTHESQRPPATDGQTAQSTAQSGGRERDKAYEIEAFPLSTAGMPMQSNAPTATDYGIYKQNIASDNIYAPFASKLDWEIARWAKAHGTTSAAVSELLKIPGVNHNHFSQIPLLTCFSGYGKPWPVIQDSSRAEWYHRQWFTITAPFSSTQSHHWGRNCAHLYARDTRMHPSIVRRC